MRPHQPGPDFGIIFCKSFGLGSFSQNLPDFGIVVIGSSAPSTHKLLFLRPQPGLKFGINSNAPSAQTPLFMQPQTCPDFSIILYSSFGLGSSSKTLPELGINISGINAPSAQTLLLLLPGQVLNFGIIFCSSFGLRSSSTNLPDFSVIAISSLILIGLLKKPSGLP